MTGVAFLIEAKQELSEAVKYYEAKCSGLGFDLLKEVEETIKYITHFPEGCQRYNDGTRRILIGRFPYILVFVFMQNQIKIVAFAHCKRRPNYWHVKDGLTQRPVSRLRHSGMTNRASRVFLLPYFRT